MSRRISGLLLFLTLSLATAAHAAPAEDSALDSLSDDKAGTVFEAAPDNVSSNATDGATSISVRGTYNYTDTVRNSGNVTTNNDVYLKGYPKDGKCGLRVDNPHPSRGYSEEIHTRIVSFCKKEELPLISNSISAMTYRSRWYGWQRVSTLAAETVSAPAPKVQNYIRTAVAKCKAGEEYRYRTEGFGTISTGVQTFSAAAYEQNDDEIQCRKL